MKDYLKTKKLSVSQKLPFGVRTAAIQLAAAILGFLASQVKLLNLLTPLGVVLAAAVPISSALSCGVGAFCGYLFMPALSTPFRYIAALFATVSIRLLTANIKKLTDAAPFCGLAVLLSQTVCNLVTFVNGGNNTAFLLLEGVLAGGLAYFMSVTFSTDYRKGIGLTGEELASAVITLDLVLIALIPVSVGEFSLGRTAGAALIISAARFGSVSAGAVCGTAVGLAAALAQNDAKMLCLYAVSGLVSGFFASTRITSVLGFALPAFITVVSFGLNESTLGMSAEILLGVAGFLILPKSIAVRLAAFFAPPVRLESMEGMRKSLVMRLKYASGALNDVAGTIDSVAGKLKRINAPEPSYMFKTLEEVTCKNCSFRVTCWETDRRETYRALGRLTKGIRRQNSDIFENIPDFAEKCLRPKEIQNNLVKIYGEYATHLRAEERIESIRGVVSDQFDGISDMLLDLSEEFDKAHAYDLDMAEKAVGALRELGFIACDCGCSTDKYGRTSIEAKIQLCGTTVPNRKRIMEQLSDTFEKTFEAPYIAECDGGFYFRITERENIVPEVGVCQIPATETGICGDAYTYFGNGFGKFYLILSDGMGTGGRAAVDGAMTVGLCERLLKAGFGYDCTLKIVNSALIYKSSEESLATVDIACIDLYTGETELFKAGAAPTVVKRGGRLGKAESKSLPIGILRDVGFDRSSVMLKYGDAVLLFSDGATSGGLEWIYSETKNFGDCTAQQLAEHLAEGAARRARGDKKDDITVMAIILKKHIT